MRKLFEKSKPALAILSVVLAACATMSMNKDVKVTLSGANEVPPVTTSASGSGNITVAADKSVSGSISTSGVAGTAGHIHIGAAGKNGPVAVPLAKSGGSGWSVPAGAKLTDDQYESFKKGELYVNIHSAANKAGEIRGQLNP